MRNIPQILALVSPFLLVSGSLATGTDLSTAAFQFVNLALFNFLWLSSKRLMLVMRFALVFPFVKLYVLSQFAKIVYFQAADTGLEEPLITNFIVSVGLIASIIFVYTVRLIEAKQATSDSLANFPNQREIFYTGILALLVGVFFTALQRMTQGQLSVVILYGSRFTYFAVVAFSVSAYIASHGKRLFDLSGVLSFVLVLALAASSGVRSDVIYPIIILACIYIYFDRRPRPKVLLAAVVALFFISHYLYPAVNYARMVNPTAVPAETMDTLGRMVVDSRFQEQVERNSDDLEGTWINRLYYLQPAGILNRFTPNQIDDIAQAVERGRIGSLSAYLFASIRAILPQTFFGDRVDAETVGMIATVANGSYSDGFNRPNFGVLASFFAFTNPPMAGVMYIISLFIMYYTAKITIKCFKYEFWTLALIPIYIQLLADGELGGLLIVLIHGTLIQTAILAMTIKFARMLAGRGAAVPRLLQPR